MVTICPTGTQPRTFSSRSSWVPRRDISAAGGDLGDNNHTVPFICLATIYFKTSSIKKKNPYFPKRCSHAIKTDTRGQHLITAAENSYPAFCCIRKQVSTRPEKHLAQAEAGQGTLGFVSYQWEEEGLSFTLRSTSGSYCLLTLQLEHVKNHYNLFDPFHFNSLWEAWHVH